MYYNEMMLAYIYSVRCYESRAFYERESEEVCEIEAHWNHRSYSLCGSLSPWKTGVRESVSPRLATPEVSSLRDS